MAKHIILRTDWNNDMEHGMLRDFEDTIIAKTEAEVYPHPRIRLGAFFTKRLQHGTRYAPLRRFIPKRSFLYKADVLWVPLMEPEDFQLDAFKAWDTLTGIKILYIFDTFPCQFPLIKRIVKCCNWDLLITSFTEAVGPLAKITQRKWHCVPQAVSLARFYPRQWNTERLPPIFISSYGRRIASYHDEIKKWCIVHRHWYDYTATDSHKLSVPTQDNYQRFADHLGSSLFTVCWPVELTHPKRAGGLSPITCRWFEAAASGAAIVGMPPKDGTSEDLFGKDAVISMPESPDQIPSWLDRLKEDRFKLREAGLARLSQYKEQWTWESRVEMIMSLIA